MSDEAIFTIGSAVLLPLLCVIAFVDLRRMIIPDVLNLLLGSSGLAYQFVAGQDAVLQLASAALMAGLFWMLRAAHARACGVIGLGLGDVKFIGAAALWIGPLQMPTLVFAASLTALLYVVGRVAVAGQHTLRQRVPFGPFLSLGLAVAWLQGEFIDSGVPW